ncbi:MAG: hypothetical protein AB1421_10900 [Pseudomonadota bacterium]
MQTLNRLSYIACVMVGMLSPNAQAAVDVPEMRSGPPLTIQMGEVRQSKRLVNGEAIVQTGKLLDGDTIERSFSDGCVTTATTKDFYAPNTTWTNCGQGPWSTGKAEDMRVKGQLWPFKVGNEVHYQWKSSNAAGQTNHRAFRSCQVTDTVMAEAAGKSYPSYRVDCSEHNNRKWVYFYAPGIDETVRFEDHHPKNGLRVMEFVERIQ